MPTLPTDDPRLTAYALGELDTAQRAEIEKLLAENEDARRFVEETRAAARGLSAELGQEASVGLDPARRAALEEHLRLAEPAAEDAELAAARKKKNRQAWLVAAAAALLLCGTGAAAWFHMLGQERAFQAELQEELGASRAQVRELSGNLHELSAGLVHNREELARLTEAIDEQEKDLATAGNRLFKAQAVRQKLEEELKATEAELQKREADLQAQKDEQARQAAQHLDDSQKLKDVLLKQQQALESLRQIEARTESQKLELENDLDATKQALATVQKDKRVVEEDLTKQTRQIETLISKNVPIWDLIGEDPKADPGPNRVPNITPRPSSEATKLREEVDALRRALKSPARDPSANQAHDEATGSTGGIYVATRYKLGAEEKYGPNAPVTKNADDKGKPSFVDQPLINYYMHTKNEKQLTIPGALILAVKPDLNLVMISAGVAQGVRTGYKLTINRGNNYVATAQVERVYPDMCSARIMIKKSDVQAHDEVLSWISEAAVEHNTESYSRVVDNPFLAVKENPLSTFSSDVDTASYSNMRRFLNQGRLPPPDAVRIEELLNYFAYEYPPPQGETPFSAQAEVAECPWAPQHRLARIGLKGREIAPDKRPPSNLVFLIDVSGSMDQENKLPLVKQGLKLLVEQLNENDRVAIAIYAGASGLLLPSTSCDRKDEILGVLEKLRAGGSTNGGEGIELAYRTAAANFIKGGVNRVILCTDGDWNVGVTSEGDLTRLIEEKAKGGVFLSVLGFGMDNYKDAMLEKLADKGNGNYGYIDTLSEARKIFVEQLSGTLVTIAKDVKIQVEFNPAEVSAYRLIGYEDRMLAKEDFNDDKKDAGEIGAGHAVTALYELVPPDRRPPASAVDALKYQQAARLSEQARNGELLTLKLRYKAPDGETSKLLEFAAKDEGTAWAKSSRDFRFAASVACFGMLLRGSPNKGLSNYDLALELAQESKGTDKSGYRAEFMELLKKAKKLQEK